ncbi:MAG: DmsC/YnfH family molybdoenzyme membrane anchor subunit [bacterium]
MKERSLLVFTILSQAAVGTTLFTCALYFWPLNTLNQGELASLLETPLLLSFLAALAALSISFFHLGKPLNAFNALRHLRSSSLSNEVFSASLFLLFLSFTLADIHYSILPEIVHQLLLASLYGIGIFFMYEMAQLYRLKTVPFWNSKLTLASFFTTTLLLGSASLYALIPLYGENNGTLLQSPKLILVFACGFFCLVQAAITLLHLRTIETFPEDIRVHLVMRRKSNRTLITARLSILSFLAILSIALSILPDLGSSDIGIVLFLLTLIAEFLGRSIFYSMFVRVGV